MSALGGLARFTPSVLDKETLEALFVHRESLVEDAVDRIRRASTTKERASRLFVGPRGAGKTHLVSLIAHRARALDGFGETFQLAWLPEDLWAIGSFDDLRREILKAVEPAEPLSDPEAMDGGPRELGGRVAQRGPIVVIIENLDQVLTDLGPDGQRKLRAAIESDRSMLLIATSSGLSTDLYDQIEPFYGFFDSVELESFSVEEAAEMLQRIAEHQGDEALAATLRTPEALSRLAAVQHLAGGQPRIWALFGAGLSVSGLNDLVPVLLERFDDLTPYYQERLKSLSVNERKAVIALAEADRPLTVRSIAESTGIGERSVAKTMSVLRQHHWVRPRGGPLVSLTDQRLTYYELTEPLVRVAFQLKAAHGGPLKLLLEFLAVWFGETLFERALEDDDPGLYLGGAAELLRLDPVVAACLRLAEDRWVAPAPRTSIDLFGHPGTPALSNLLLDLDLALVALEWGDPSPLLSLPTSVVTLIESEIARRELIDVRLELARVAVGVGSDPEWSRRVGEIVQRTDGERRAMALTVLAVHDAGAGDHRGAEHAAAGVVEQVSMIDVPSPSLFKALTWGAAHLMEDQSASLAADLLEVSATAANSEEQMEALSALLVACLSLGEWTRLVTDWRLASEAARREGSPVRWLDRVEAIGALVLAALVLYPMVKSALDAGRDLASPDVESLQSKALEGAELWRSGERDGAFSAWNGVLAGAAQSGQVHGDRLTGVRETLAVLQALAVRDERADP